MKIKVLLIAPYRGLAELAAQMVSELEEFEVTVKEGDLEEAVGIARHLHSEPYDLIISRGGTANLLRSQLSQPVVEIPLSGYDILRTLTLVKDYKTKVQMIAFPNITQGVLAVSSLMGIEIPSTVIHSQEEVEEAIQQAKQQGVQVVVGDTVTVRIAKEYGLQGILTISGRESIRDAFAQAKQLYQIIIQSQKKERAYQQIFAQLDEGIAIIDSQGNFQYKNQSFSRLFQISPDNQQNLSVIKAFPNWFRLLQSMKEEEKMIFEQENQEGKLQITIGPFFKAHYYIKAKPWNPEKEGLWINYITPPVTSFTQIPGTSQQIQRAKEQAKSIGNSRVIALVGEKGGGKKLFTGAIHGTGVERNGVFVELTMNKKEPHAFNKFHNVIEGIRSGTVLIRGIEKWGSFVQQQIAHWIQTQHRQPILIFTFQEKPEKLVKEGRLAAELTQCWLKQVIEIPVLQDRLEDLDDMIRYYIGSYNEKYGKQIVGLRPNVRLHLHEQVRKGQVTDVGEIVKELVRKTTTEFVEEDAWKQVWIENSGPATNDGLTKTIEIDLSLNHSLQQMEKLIIKRVLEDEGMNQTRTAKRLGMTRATLWRKLKDWDDH